jgi:hypothetical protein
MACGDLDWVHPGCAAAFVALRRLGVPVEYRLYEGDGHVMAGRANVIDFWQRRLSFFAEHLDVAVDGNGAIVFEEGRAQAAHPQP